MRTIQKPQGLEPALADAGAAHQEPFKPLRVVVAHDYVTQRGGAERVVLGLLQAFPGSRLVTTVYARGASFPEFRHVDIQTSWLNAVPAFRRDPRLAFPLLARTWEHTTIDDADVVICSSSGWSHGVLTDAPKIVYCHNPARWLHQPTDYLAGASLPARMAQRVLTRRLQSWDRRHAESAAAYVSNSRVVAGRVLEAYGRESLVVPPPVTLDATGPQEPVPGLEPGFLLTVARARGYKNTALVCDAVRTLPGERLVIAGSFTAPSPAGDAPQIAAVGRVSDAQLRWLYAHCTAVVSASHEDFGITPLEGNAFGKPAVVLRAGGFLDTLAEGITGCFIDEESVEGVRAAILARPSVEPQVLRTYAEGFGQDVFRRRMQEVVHGVLPAHARAIVGKFEAV